MTIWRREDISSAESAHDKLSDGAKQLQWWATTWFKSSAASVGAVLLILFAGLAIFVCRPWRQSVKAEKRLAKIRQELLLNAIEDPDTQPLFLKNQHASLPRSNESTIPPPPRIPYRPGMRTIHSGLGNTPRYSRTVPEGSTGSRGSERSQEHSQSSMQSNKGFIGEKETSVNESSRTDMPQPQAGPQLQMTWGREHSTEARLTQPPWISEQRLYKSTNSQPWQQVNLSRPAARRGRPTLSSLAGSAYSSKGRSQV